MSGAFARYAAWYDAFNAGKDYAAEAEYLLGEVARWRPRPATWLDLGCGTGHHLAALRARGLAVEGVDASPHMLAGARALHPDLPLRLARAQELRLEGRRDVVSMLFHGIGYQVTDDALHAALLGMARHVAGDGVVLLDFWSTEAVRRDPPRVRVRRAEVDGRPLVRSSHPSEEPARDLVRVRFEFRWDAPDGPLAHEELHEVRHFTPAGLERHLAAAGLELASCEAWMARRPLGPDDWYGLAVARPRARP